MASEAAAERVTTDVVASRGDDGAEHEGDAVTSGEDPRVDQEPGERGQHAGPAEGENCDREVRQRRRGV